MSLLNETISVQSPPAREQSRPPLRSVIRRAKERVIQSILFLCAFSAVLITTGIVFLLVLETTRFFYRFGEVAIVLPEGMRSDEKQVEKQLEALNSAVKSQGWKETETLARTLPGGGKILVVHTTTGDFDAAKSALAAQGFKVDAGQSTVRPNLREFFSGRTWSPEYADPQYGILPLLSGTLMITLVALLVALPLGTIAAIYLSEYAPHAVRETLKPVLELLSAVPTVVYGYFALLFVTPLLKKYFFGDALQTYNMLSAGLVMGIMIIPYVSSLSEDAMRAVPMSLREGSYAMGGTRMQTALRVVVPASFSGMTAAYILGISRAIGETMVVALAAGNLRSLTANPTREAQTITSYIVQVAGGDLPHGSIGFQSIFAAGLVLFVLTLLFNIAGYYLRKRYREAY